MNVQIKYLLSSDRIALISGDEQIEIGRDSNWERFSAEERSFISEVLKSRSESFVPQDICDPCNRLILDLLESICLEATL